MNKEVITEALFTPKAAYIRPLFEGRRYPWLILSEIGTYIKQLLDGGIRGYRELFPGVLVGEGVKISEHAVIAGPAVIGAGCELRPGAYLRGNVLLGEGCVIGNSTELKNCVLLDRAQAPHYNYIGDSILGCRAHMGAGSICSNLKADGRDVIVRGEVEYPTGLRKVGAFLGDGADIGCGCVLNPGTVIGKDTSVYPLTSLRGVYPASSIVKAQNTVVKRR